MNKYLTDKDKSSCCGCNMCAHICPTDAIFMQYDDEGFAFPSVKPDLCVGCNKCATVCPIENPSKNQKEPQAYAAHSRDSKTLMQSSSGGIFTEVAKTVISGGGYVCGCTIDNNHQVKHIIISDEKDIPLLQGSKYVQSDMSNCLDDISRVLKEGKRLLFVGTPCQVSAVKKAFNSPNLITIDLLCHGVPSQKLFDFYIKYLEEKHKGKLTEIVFRDKEKFGWSITQRYKIRKKNKEKTYYLERHISEYFSGFLRNMTQRYSCYACPYTTAERAGDITLADFWGVDKVRPELLNMQGTSLVLTNTQVGQDIVLSLKDRIDIEPVSFEDATYQNINFISPPEKNPLRDSIYSSIFSNGFKSSGRQYLLPKNSYKYKIAQLLNINIAKLSFIRGKKR